MIENYLAQQSATLLCQDSWTPSTIPDSHGQIKPASVVVGLEVDDDILLSPFYGTSTIYERELTLPSAMIGRLATFYEQHLTGDPNTGPMWNCHTFVASIMGWKTGLDHKRQLINARPGNEIEPEDIVREHAYVIKNIQGEIMHSTLGIGASSAECLGAGGLRRPLKIMTAQDTVALWGKSIHEYKESSVNLL